MKALALALLLLSLAPAARAHESRPAYLELREVAPGRYEMLWRTPTFSGLPLPVELALPADLHDVAPPRTRTLPDSQVEQRLLERAGGLAGQRIEFPGLQATITDVLVRVQSLDGGTSTEIVRPSRPWLEIAASQGTAAVIGTYLVHGIEHILLGADHLLFVFGLMLIVRDRWQLLQAITAFTVAHSLTLALATLGFANAPVEPLNAAIALSILFLGPEIVRSWRGGTSLTIRRPWGVAFAFGLLHGFGFASALTGAGLPRAELPLALLGFNLGVEVGQIAFVAFVLGLERSFRQLEIRWPRWVALVPGYAVGSLGAFWVIQRTLILFGGVALLLALWPATAFAHARGGEALGFTSGLLHPISGLDHVLAMIAVGLWGAQLGPPALWLLPVTFPLVMAFGGMLGLLGIPLPGIEIGIALSAIALGAAVTAEARPPLWVAAIVVGFFAIFHGHAHGTELPPAADGVLYSIGFVVATGLLHATGIATGLVHRFPTGRIALRAAGAGVAFAGVAFLWQAVA